MRRYDQGNIVGDPDPPVPLDEWLRRQREAIEKLDPSPYVFGRLQMLKEVEMAVERAKAARPTDEPEKLCQHLPDEVCKWCDDIPLIPRSPQTIGIKLWVDDEREAPEGEGWVRATSVRDALLCLESFERIAVMSLDFSLGDGDATEILDWIKMRPEYWPKVVRAHSSSYDGRRLIKAIVEGSSPHTTTFEED